MQNAVIKELAKYLSFDDFYSKEERELLNNNSEKANEHFNEERLISLSKDILTKELKSKARSKYFEEHFRLKELILSAEIYLQCSNIETAYFLHNKIYKKSLKLKQLSPCLLALDKKLHYEFMNGLSNYKKTLKLYRKFEEFSLILANLKIDGRSLSKKIKENKHSSSEIILFADSIIQTYSPYKNKIPSHIFHFKLYEITNIYLGMSNNKHLIPESLNEALEYFQKGSLKFIPGMVLCYNFLTIYYLNKKEFDSAQELIDRALKLIKPDHSHWLTIKELEILFLFSHKKYMESIKVYHKVKIKIKDKSLNRLSKDRWKIMEAYVHVATETLDSTTKKKYFSISKFMNEVPIYSKDKRTYNVSILVAQMSLFIIRKNYDRAMERIEPLNKYASRYLKRNETFRSNCFIKMLIEIPKYNFNKLRVERHTKKLREKLSTMSLADSQQAFFSEIIPYENLWEIIMDSLDAKTQYSVQK